jgi:hypothetical protein
MKGVRIDKSKFDAVLRILINALPTTFKEVAAKPKPPQGERFCNLKEIHGFSSGD